jgi:hypothetical protein
MGSTSSRMPRKLRWGLGIFFGSIALLALLFAVVYVLVSTTSSNIAVDESRAVGSLRTIHNMETSYVSQHPSSGFACALPQMNALKPPASQHTSIDLDRGEWGGYKFEVVSCTSPTTGDVGQYQVIAVPLRQYATGVRAFCIDQSGIIFYDVNGSGSGCLTSRKQLQY